ncbi:P-loop containing nucleoside triphosphate hydrolase protein [Tricholoma matsutake]|nr:P-loop containing nucleoside triphosphate hydrolase protein [Tricholoma matsutake 945]
MRPSPPLVMSLMQTLIDGELSLVPIPTTTIKESKISTDALSVFDHARPIGISPGYSKDGKLVALAIADDENCKIIEFVLTGSLGRTREYRASSESTQNRNQDGLLLLQEKVLCRNAGDLFAFDMAPLSLLLYCDASLRVTHGVDIQSGVSAVDRKPLTAILEIVGDTAPVIKENVVTVFRNPVYDKDDRNRATDLAMRAWISQFLASYQNGAETLAKVERIDTMKLMPETLNMIAKIARDSLRLDQMKPTQTKHQFTVTADVSTGQPKVNSLTYKNKIRGGQPVRMSVEGPGSSLYNVTGHVGSIKGRTGALSATHSLSDKTITTLTSIGRDDPTTAEAQRGATVLRILQGNYKLLDENPWITNIWFPSDDGVMIWPNSPSLTSQQAAPLLSHTSVVSPGRNQGHHNLNSSQKEAVNTMFSTMDSHRITIIQGPPGTGKTSVIAAFVQHAIEAGYGGIWLVAQSNVAVKNIGEKLLDVGFNNWKLLVSKEFHFQWHEHIYTKVQHNVILSESFAGISANEFKNFQVMLCTLSMLSNSRIKKFTSKIPIRTLVVDEASQIEVGDYISVFSDFHSTLCKAIFIGDDKQCMFSSGRLVWDNYCCFIVPPYGQEDLQDLQSIFEIAHLRKFVLFLNMQYRMPPQIGQMMYWHAALLMYLAVRRGIQALAQ